MCAKCDDGIVFNRIKLYVTAIVLIATVVSTFAFVQYKVEENAEDIEKICKRTERLETQTRLIDEIRYNLRSLCEKQGVNYIEK